jgi:hypothetical protein
MIEYDSKADTLEHIKKVNNNINSFCRGMLVRASIHDNSKLEEPEKGLFDEMTPILKDLTYGSDEYKASLERLKPALQHHYQNNSHHPEFYENGINGMNLFDLVEMYCDWKAAVERTKDGDMTKSIAINELRFEMGPQLANIFRNTINKM